jgi:AraC family transcriptional regulator
VEDWQCRGHDTPGRHPEHNQDDLLVFTRAGCWQLDVAGERQLIDPLTVVQWQRDTDYRVRHPVAGGDRCTVVRLSREAAELLGENGSPGLRARSLDAAGSLQLRRLLILLSAAGGADPLAVEESVLELLRHVCAGCELRSAPKQVERARQIIARDFRGPLSAHAIAREAGCSPFHLGRLFRRATGMSIHETTTDMRLRAALELLHEGAQNIAAIALDVGFASHSHFCDAFRNRFGCTPGAVRGKKFAD